MNAIVYRNWRGEVAERRIQNGGTVHFAAAPPWHPEPCWLLTAFDLDKQAWRTFKLADVLSWNARATAPPAARTLGDSDGG